MTAWTPQIRVEYLAPNTDHSNPATVLDGWIDYSIATDRGTSEYISAPYPMSTTLNLLFDENVIPEVALGSFVTISIYDVVTTTWKPVHSGYVTDMNSGYRSYGVAGFVLDWQLNLTSGISILQNAVWYNDTSYTSTTSDCFAKVADSAGVTMWNQVKATLTWQNIGPESWESFDTPARVNIPITGAGLDTKTQTLTAGYRNVWDDLVTIVYGVYGWIYEQADAIVTADFPNTPLTSLITLTQDMLDTTIVGGQTVGELRNVVTITEFDNVESTYYETDSRTLYNDRVGSLSTYLTTTLEAADVGQSILNGLAYPLLCTKQVTVNLLNPVFTDAQRQFLLFDTIGTRITVEAPSPMGGTQDYLVIGCQFQMTKDSFIAGLTLAPYGQVYNSPNWLQIPYNYTWTSYGVAFPTQEWQDL